MELPLILFGWLAVALLGAYVGSFKNRGLSGFVLALFFSALGVIVVAMLPTRPPEEASKAAPVLMLLLVLLFVGGSVLTVNVDQQDKDIALANKLREESAASSRELRRLDGDYGSRSPSSPLPAATPAIAPVRTATISKPASTPTPAEINAEILRKYGTR